jgi:hypothetical protein
LIFSSYRNEIKKLVNEDDAIVGFFAFGQPLTRTVVGRSIGQFYGFVTDGLFRSQEELDNGPIPEQNVNAQNPEFTGTWLGDIRFKDLDGDGVITDDDRTFIGDPNPDFTFGLTNTFSYKNFDLNVFFQGAVGGDIYNLTAIQLYNGDSNGLTDVLNSWTPENTDTDIPRAAIRGRERSSRFVEDGSYMRLKNVALGYTLDNSKLRNIGFSSARLTLSAQNLLTFTNYSGLDPEVSYFGSGGESLGDDNVIQGHDFGNYPNVKSITVGVNLKF